MSLKILPLELILSILENLDWSEILVIRQTCKLLNQASRERTVLQSWVARCMLNIPKAAFRLERPISRYTSEELEAIIRRWKAAEQGWVTERRGLKTRPNIAQAPTHTQRQIHTDRPSKVFHLVQGGRWLLVVSITGSVSYYDLDSANRGEGGGIGPATPLIPDLTPRRPWTVVLIAVDMIDTEPFLTLNLAIYTRIWLGFTSEQIHLWRITLQVDEHNVGVGLSSKHITTLASLGLSLSPSAISLCGDYIAWDFMENTCNIIIVDWTQPGSRPNAPKAARTLPTRRVVHLGPEMHMFHLLPGKRLLLASGPWIKLYDLNLLPICDPDDYAYAIQPHYTLAHSPLNSHTPVITTRSVWRTTLQELFAGSLSKPFMCPRTGTVRFVVYTRTAVYGLIIPLVDSHLDGAAAAETKIVKLTDYGGLDGEPCGFNSGYYTAVLHTFKPQTVILRYKWPDQYGLLKRENQFKNIPIAKPRTPKREVSMQKIQRKVAITCKNWDPFTPMMDEGSGRLVLSAQSGKELVVVDFSTISPTN